MSARATLVIGAELIVLACLAAWGVLGALGPAGGPVGGPAAGWVFSRTAEQGFAEARCSYDLSKGPVRVTVEPWAGPLSLDIKGARGERVFSADQASAPQGVDLVLATKGQATPRGARVAISPSPTGTAIQRRGAPTPERFAEADAARRGDSCAPAGLDFPAARR